MKVLSENIKAYFDMYRFKTPYRHTFVCFLPKVPNETSFRNGDIISFGSKVYHTNIIIVDTVQYHDLREGEMLIANQFAQQKYTEIVLLMQDAGIPEAERAEFGKLCFTRFKFERKYHIICSSTEIATSKVLHSENKAAYVSSMFFRKFARLFSDKEMTNGVLEAMLDASYLKAEIISNGEVNQPSLLEV